MTNLLKAIILELRYRHLHLLAVRQLGREHAELIDLRAHLSTVRDELCGAQSQAAARGVNADVKR